MPRLSTTTYGDNSEAECPWCGKQMSMVDITTDGCLHDGYEGTCPHCEREYEILDVEMIAHTRIGRRDTAAEKAMIGQHVATTFAGRDLLGTVTAVHGGVFSVRHFNGEPWPFRPRMERLTVIERDEAQGEEAS